MIHATPQDTFTTIAEDFATGLVGTIGVRTDNADRTNHTARTTAGIVELEAAVGAYAEGLPDGHRHVAHPRGDAGRRRHLRE